MISKEPFLFVCAGFRLPLCFPPRLMSFSSAQSKLYRPGSRPRTPSAYAPRTQEMREMQQRRIDAAEQRNKRFGASRLIYLLHLLLKQTDPPHSRNYTRPQSLALCASPDVFTSPGLAGGPGKPIVRASPALTEDQRLDRIAKGGGSGWN